MSNKLRFVLRQSTSKSLELRQSTSSSLGRETHSLQEGVVLPHLLTSWEPPGDRVVRVKEDVGQTNALAEIMEVTVVWKVREEGEEGPTKLPSTTRMFGTLQATRPGKASAHWQAARQQPPPCLKQHSGCPPCLRPITGWACSPLHNRDERLAQEPHLEGWDMLYNTHFMLHTTFVM